VLVSCSGSGSGGATADPASLLESAVGVEATGCSLVASIGSGVVLADDTVVTTAHTVAGADAIVVVGADGVRHDAALVGFDPDADLAVLAVDGLDVEPLPLGPAERGATGWVLAWHPDVGMHTEPMTVTKEIRVTIEDIYIDRIVQRDAIEVAADIEHGDSGAAVVSDDGTVVGVVYATSRERAAGFAVDDGEVAAALALAAGRTPVDAGPCV
jgi:S1-C subfamily serine protease